ncbi:MAG: peptidoglycan DD-metalloendopeptidase family protein [Candidatus Uhrbacteria bacterium]
MKKSIVVVLVCALLVLGGFIAIRGAAFSDADTNTGENNVVAAPPWIIESIADGDTFAVVMDRIGVSYSDALAIVDASEEVFDFTMIRAGHDFRYLKEEDVLSVLEYDVDTEEFVRVQRGDDGFVVTRALIPYEVTTETAQGIVTTSLYENGLADGVPEEIILEFADVFAWTIDFATQVQQGDQYRVVYERRTRDGSDAGYGVVFVGEFVNTGTSYHAYRFANADGKPTYYDDAGTSLIRPMLRAPLKFSYISSGYTYARFHPTLQRATPHLAIDYAAAIGTPVLAVGDGVVGFAGWNGGYGNYIDIRHNSTYSTQYAHLSAYAKGIRAGAHVKQGQVIGYVGSTGFSTGPHLHYQIKKNGSLINPLKLELPPGDPVPEELRAEFEARRAELEAMLPS